jgi:hypothetical protein
MDLEGMVGVDVDADFVARDESVHFGVEGSVGRLLWNVGLRVWGSGSSRSNYNL